MVEKTIVIGALARDCAESIVRNKHKIEELRAQFSKSYVVIIENDSKDNTKQVLAEYEKESYDVHVISKDYNGTYPFSYTGKATHVGMSCNRIARMVFFRNKLIDYIRANFTTDYIYFLDIDVFDFSVTGIIKSIESAPTDWGALFANGYYTYKTLFGVRPMPNQYDSYAFLDLDENQNMIPVQFMDKRVQYKRSVDMSHKIKRSEFMPCLSAFGGAAIYKIDAIKNASYSVFIPYNWRQHGTCICEHIPFNSFVITNKYKCYISKKMTVNYGLYKLPGIKGLLLKISPTFLSWLSSLC